MELGVEIHLDDPDSFLKIKETLSRIGICSVKNKTLYQSCHVLHKKGKYYIMHFKELFILDRKESDFSVEDKQRRDAIVGLLEDWGLAKIVGARTETDKAILSKIKIIPFKEKDNWNLVQKYQIGVKKV